MSTFQQYPKVQIVNGYSMIADNTSTANVTYYGRCQPGLSGSTGAAIWSINAVTVDSNNNIISDLWANGTNSFINTWSNRLTYTYN